MPAVAVLYLIFQPRLQLRTVDLLLFLLALPLAFLLRFFVEWAVALTAFWTTRTDAVSSVYFLLLLFLSGRIAPLDLLPEWAQRVASITPFRWAIAFPVELLLGRLSLQQAWRGLAAQALWVLGGLLLVGVVWRRGVRRFAAVGS